MCYYVELARAGVFKLSNADTFDWIESTIFIHQAFVAATRGPCPARSHMPLFTSDKMLRSASAQAKVVSGSRLMKVRLFGASHNTKLGVFMTDITSDDDFLRLQHHLSECPTPLRLINVVSSHHLVVCGTLRGTLVFADSFVERGPDQFASSVVGSAVGCGGSVGRRLACTSCEVLPSCLPSCTLLSLHGTRSTCAMCEHLVNYE